MQSPTPERRVGLIAETPSLAAALHELLESERIPVSEVGSLEEAEALHTGPRGKVLRLLVAASNRPRCDSARNWRKGLLATLPLVVVGSRDPALTGATNLHVVRLPLDPREVLSLVRSLLEAPA